MASSPPLSAGRAGRPSGRPGSCEPDLFATGVGRAEDGSGPPSPSPPITGLGLARAGRPAACERSRRSGPAGVGPGPVPHSGRARGKCRGAVGQNGIRDGEARELGRDPIGVLSQGRAPAARSRVPRRETRPARAGQEPGRGIAGPARPPPQRACAGRQRSRPRFGLPGRSDGDVTARARPDRSPRSGPAATGRMPRARSESQPEAGRAGGRARARAPVAGQESERRPGP